MPPRLNPRTSPVGASPSHAWPNPTAAFGSCHVLQTINKAQGQTLERVGIYLPDPCFTHGQLYVAASRVGLPTQLRFAVPQDEWTGTFRTRNIVFREVLSRELGANPPGTAGPADWSYDPEEDTSFIHDHHHGGGADFHFCGPEPDPDDDARPEPSAAVRALEAAESAARAEYTRLARLHEDDGAGVFDLVFYRARARERVRQAATAVVAALEAEAEESHA